MTDNDFPKDFTIAMVPSREETSIHEAGHVVVARVLNFDVEYVTIEPNGRAHGHASIHRDWVWHDPFKTSSLEFADNLMNHLKTTKDQVFQRQLRKRIAIDIAGYVATDMVDDGNRDFEVPCYPESHKDEIAVALALSELLTNGRGDYRKIVQWAKDVLNQHIGSVTKLRNELIEKTTIQGCDIDIEITQREVDEVFPSTWQT